MGNVFSMDKDGNKLDEMTSNPEILKMISKGKSVSIFVFLSLIKLYSSKLLWNLFLKAKD